MFINPQRNEWRTTLVLFSLIIATMFLFSSSVSNAASGAEFCWKNSYGRGVGSVPLSCPAGTEKRGLLCYSKCLAGMKRAGVDCHSTCPSGLKDQGLFCRKAEYGRGGGYISRKKCKRKRGNCEKTGLLFYPKCRAGFKRFGCCICRPNKPDCRALGLKPGIDLSCAKRIQLGKIRKANCPRGKQRDAGLCYKRCRAGYKGVGPVCWGGPPSGWVHCGMGASKTKGICGKIIFNQVSSVGQLALTVVTLGGSSGATAAAKAPQSASKLAKLKKKYAQMKAAFQKAKKGSKTLQKAEKAYKKGKKAYDTARPYLKTATAAKTAQNVVTAEDMARMAAQIAAIVDSSGVSDVVGAYTYPKCSKYLLPKRKR